MSALYTEFKNRLMKGEINLEVQSISAILVDSADYTFDAAHTSLLDVPPASIIGTPVDLIGKTVNNGVFDAEDLLFPPTTGDTIEGLLIYLNTGVSSSSTLIAWIDNSGALVITPTGVGIGITFSPSGIFAL